MKLAATLLVAAALGLAFVWVQSHLAQIHHDSCRLWREPPPWSSFCPPSTRHGVRT